MKSLGFILATAGIFAAAPAGAADHMLFEINVKKDGELIAKPSVLAAMGQPVSLRIGGGIAFEASSEPAETAGNYWSKIRITYFETPDSRMVQEMSMRHDDGGSFEYTDPSGRRFVVYVRRVDR